MPDQEPRQDSDTSGDCSALDLDSLGILEGTDKSSLGNGYLTVYQDVLAPYRNQAIDVLEIGVFGGASVRMWASWLPLARIIGVDIAPASRALEADRIVIEIGSQADPGFLATLASRYRPTVIIDDGSHIAADIQLTFETLFPVLEPGGLYIVEDTYLHFGPVAEQNRGQTPLSLWEYFSDLGLGKIRQWLTPERDRPPLRGCFDQIAEIGFARGLIIIRKAPARKPAPSTAVIEQVARRRGRPRDWFGAAGILMAAGDHKAAEAMVRRAIAMEPERHEYHRRLGELLERQGNLPGAAAAMETAAAIAPNDPHYPDRLAHMRIGLGDLPGATEAIRRVTELYPRNPHAWRLLAELLHRQGERQASTEAWDQALTLAAGMPFEAEWRAAAASPEAVLPPPEDPAPLIEAAWAAHHRRQHTEALAQWQALQTRFPDHPVPWAGAAATLRDQGAFDAADALLESALARFPDATWLIFDHAWVAHLRRDWQEAGRRWARARAERPDDPVGLVQGAKVARELGELDTAAAMLAEARARFPADPHAPMEAAWTEAARGNHAAAAALWAELRAARPEEEVAWTAGARALRESGQMAAAEALLAAAVARFPDRAAPLSEYAWAAQIRRDWPEAVARWAALRARFPDQPDGYLQAARALREQWRHAEAEALLAEGLARLPDAAPLALEHAWLAYHQRDWPEATLRFSLARDRWPDQPDAWLGAALTARDQSRLAEADTILAAGMARLADHPGLALEHALLPVFPIYAEDKDRPESLARMARLRERFPGWEPGWRHSIRLLREAGREAEAEALAETAAARLPDSLALAGDYAEAALTRGDAAAGRARFQVLAARFPDAPEGPIGLARVQALAGDGAAAEATLQAARARFPAAAEVIAAQAALATDRQDWPRAVALWGEAAARFPDAKDYAHRLYEARIRLMESDPAAETALATQFAPAPKPDPASIDSGVRDLAMQFESLGGRALGCEFGIFQRDCGAEPLGLLRWADMPYDALVDVLDSRFAGVGDAANTELFTTAVSGGRAEYCTRDRRRDMMFMRAFIYEDEMAFDAMFASACRRLRFLTRKLIEDLERGSKIFVYRLTDRTLTAAELDRLHRAVRSYGDNTLLYVRLADAAHPSGTVLRAAPGLLVGHMDRFKMSPEGVLSAAPATASWLAVCRAAYALWTASG